jgi:hypothetical protein
MKLNEHMKKGCEKFVDDDIIFAKGGNVLEYHAKLEVVTKLRCNWVFNFETSSINVIEKEKKKSSIVEIFDDDIFEVTEHGIDCKKWITKPTS